MKNLIVVILSLLLSSQAIASYYDSGKRLNEYDQETGYFYTLVKQTEERGLLKGSYTKAVDIYIYFPKENKGKYLFSGNNKKEIVTVLYETLYDNAKHSIIFNSCDNSYAVKNNKGITERQLKNKILVYLFDKEKNKYELWQSNKKGENLKLLKEISKKTNWHIDVLNSQIRFISQKDQEIKIENLDW
jgi:hypothetical protein